VFLGHFGLGLAAKRWTPAVSLGALFLAGQLADLVWPALVLAGYERLEIRPGVTRVTPLDFVHYPYSHSLVALALWAAAFALGYWLLARRRTPVGAAAGATVLSLLVLSHWLLDWLTHRPDLPLTLGGERRFGLGLWNSLPGTLLAEGVLYVAGVALYARATRAKDRTGRIALWLLVGFLPAVWLATLFGPPPPTPTAVAASALSMWLLVAWGAWLDRHREARAS
jgi:hypothetical protein